MNLQARIARLEANAPPRTPEPRKQIYGTLSIAGQEISEAAGTWHTAHALAQYGARHAAVYAETALENAERHARSVLDAIAEHRAASAAACLEE